MKGIARRRCQGKNKRERHEKKGPGKLEVTQVKGVRRQGGRKEGQAERGRKEEFKLPPSI